MQISTPKAIRKSSSKYNHIFIICVLLYALIFTGLTILVGSLLLDKTSILDIVFFIGFEFLLIGVAYDLTETILAFFLSPASLPKHHGLDNTPAVALLITVCDDVIPEILKRLSNQTYANYDIYVLDDSSQESQRQLVNKAGHFVVRRRSRWAFKAGNLNNWLDKYGHNYKYFVVLDSDSVLEENFIRNMVEYAEHPQNKHVGLLQSKIRPWNTSSLFPRILGCNIPLRQFVLERVSNRNGMFLAYGLNYMCRTDCVLKVGGFHENVSAEDTTLSLMLSSKGYAIKLVDVLSYYSEPQNLFYYRRQITRWSAQTMELFRLSWGAVSFQLKLRICFSLYNYLRPFMYIFLLLIAAWSFQPTDLSIRNLINLVIQYKLYYSSWFLILCVITSIWIWHVSLNLILAKRAEIPLKNYLLHILLVQSLLYNALFHVGASITLTAFGKRVQFDATNVKISSHPTFKSIAKCMLIPIALSTAILTGIIFRNHFFLLSPSFLWFWVLLSAPLLIWLFHFDNVGLEKEANEL